jgi:hypothetical protein
MASAWVESMHVDLHSESDSESEGQDDDKGEGSSKLGW